MVTGAQVSKMLDKIVHQVLDEWTEKFGRVAENNQKTLAEVRELRGRIHRLETIIDWGRTFVDDLLPIQRRLNELDAQVVDLRERGKPSLYLPADGQDRPSRASVPGGGLT